MTTDPYRLVTVTAPPAVIEVDPFRAVEVITDRVVEVEKYESRVIKVTDALKYTSNKMTFVVGTTSASPVSVGDKQTYGTRFNDGTVYQWVISTDVPTTLSAKITKTSNFPTFADMLSISLVNDSYATGSVSIPIQHLDILNLVVVSNDLARRISIELFIR